MPKNSTQLITTLLVLFIGVVSVTAYILSKTTERRQSDATTTRRQGDQRLQISIPDATWVPDFFESLDRHTKKINLPDLKTIVLPNKDDLEVRYWADSLPNYIDGVILRRINNQWSGVHIYIKYKGQDFSLTQKELPLPKSDWAEAWEKLVKAGILRLPDATEVRCNETVIDGIGFVVETNFNWTYRTYAYGNPQLAKCDEAKQIISIAQILFDEFNLYDSEK